jgi:hypothetical protein
LTIIALSIVLCSGKHPAVQFTLFTARYHSLLSATNQSSLSWTLPNNVATTLANHSLTNRISAIAITKAKMISNMIFATAILASAPFANALGKAVVKNACNYEIKMCNTPAANGGHEEVDKWLQPNETYSQQYTELSNGNGWSIKLSDTESLEHILQYEYTTHSDGIIWYDLSQVDGNPWYGNWQITTDSENCNPKQQAYRYANDDAYGMQSCPDDADIMVTLCSGEGYNDELAAEASASVAAASQANTVSWGAGAGTGGYETSSAAGSSSTASSASASSVSSAPASYGNWGYNKGVEQATTLVTKASATPTDNVVYHTIYKTVYARETAPAQRAHRRHGHDQH